MATFEWRDRPRPRLLMSIIAIAALLVLSTGAAPPRQTPAPAEAATTPVWTITRFDTTERALALTFDAGSDRGYASQILDVLRDKGVRASFGMTGVWASQNPDLVQRMVREGHHLMNHSWDHPNFTEIAASEQTQQLARTEAIVRAVAGVDLKPYFRPPYGAYDAAVLQNLAANGYSLNVMWTIDTLGWQGLSPAAITQRVLSGAAPGVIVLMHVGIQSQDAVALPGIIDALRARGYRFGTVADFVSGRISEEHRYFPETGHWVSHGFLAYWEQFGGLPVFGYPLTEEYRDPQTQLVTQWFERARFEWHPGAWPARYDVLLGRLGVELARRQDLLATAPFQPIEAASDRYTTYFPETGHRLAFGFRAYWQAHGGLPIFGYPISEEFRDPRTGLTVQYFERQRLEWHPDNPPAWQVLGGRLGAELLPPQMVAPSGGGRGRSM